MPNGLECELPEPETHAPVQVGGGRLEGDHGTVLPGPAWDPRPSPRFTVVTDPGLPAWPLASLTGLGPGLTPLGDDIAIGFLGAQALFGRDHSTGRVLAASLAARTTSLSGTLLRLAAAGELPEAAHRLLEDGDPEPLLAWGASSGSGLLTGLGLCETALSQRSVRALDLTLPFSPPRSVHVEIHELGDQH